MDLNTSRTNSRLLKLLAGIFSIDLRALALFRTVFGSLILFDLLHAFRGSSVFYSDAGLLPRTTLIQNAFRDGSFSVYLFGGSPAFVKLLISTHIVILIGFIVGYRTRLCTVLSWIMLVSLQNRNPIVNHGGDMIFRLMTFWSIFLPLGGAWSIDAFLNSRRNLYESPGGDAKTENYFGMASIAALLQVAFIYLCTSQLKSGRTWHNSGTALKLALSNQEYSTALGLTAAAKIPEIILQHLTTAALTSELILPLLLFMPWKNGLFRLLAIAGLLALHIGIDLFMKVGMISVATATTLLLFLPGRLFRKSAVPESAVSYLSPLSTSTLKRPLISKCQEAAVAVCLIYVLLFNLSTLSYPLAIPLVNAFPSFFQNTLRLDQRWNMFAPNPPVSQGYLLPIGYFKHNQPVNLRNKLLAPEPEKLPRYIDYRNDWRWQKFSDNIRRDHFRVYRKVFAQMLVSDWNADKATTDPDRLQFVKLFIAETRLDKDDPQTTLTSLGEFVADDTGTSSAQDVWKFIYR